MFASKPGLPANEAQKAENPQDCAQILRIAGLVLALLLSGTCVVVAVSFADAKAASLPHLPKSRLSASAGAKMTSTKRHSSAGTVSSASSAVTIPQTRVSMMRDWMVGHKRLTAVILAVAILAAVAVVVLCVVFVPSQQGAATSQTIKASNKSVQKDTTGPAVADSRLVIILAVLGGLILLILALVARPVYAYCRLHSMMSKLGTSFELRVSKAALASNDDLEPVRNVLKEIKTLALTKRVTVPGPMRDITVSLGAGGNLGNFSYQEAVGSAAELYVLFYQKYGESNGDQAILLVGSYNKLLFGNLDGLRVHVKALGEAVRTVAEVEGLKVGLGILKTAIERLPNRDQNSSNRPLPPPL